MIEKTKTEWGLLTVDGRVHNVQDYRHVEAWNVRGQRTRIVTREVTVVYSDWK